MPKLVNLLPFRVVVEKPEGLFFRMPVPQMIQSCKTCPVNCAGGYCGDREFLFLTGDEAESVADWPRRKPGRKIKVAKTLIHRIFLFDCILICVGLRFLFTSVKRLFYRNVLASAFFP